MKLGTLSLAPTTYAYQNVDQMISDYFAGRPVLVRGYGPLGGLSIDCYEESTLRSLGYSALEFRYGAYTKEIPL